MGIYRFKLSAMTPNAWFYKLRDMSRNKKQTTHHSHKKNQSSKHSTTHPSKPKQAYDPFNARKSYYFTRELNPKLSNSNSHEPPPGKPSKKTPNSRTPMIKSYSPPDDHSSSPFETSAETEFPEPDEFRTDCLLLTEAFHQTVSRHSKSRTRKDVKLIINGHDPSPQFEPPVITIKKKENKPRSRFTASSPGVAKLQTNSPRRGSRKIHTRGRGRSASSSSPSAAASRSMQRRRNWDSLAIVKRSRNPERDFRESMVEMIVENKMKEWKELEDLLASYLYLNSEEYHELIIQVFKQIWYDLSLDFGGICSNKITNKY